MSLFFNGFCIGSILFAFLVSSFWMWVLAEMTKQKQLAFYHDGEWITGDKKNLKKFVEK
jgi:hypothetical protein